jgi:hypothetical protein
MSPSTVHLMSQQTNEQGTFRLPSWLSWAAFSFVCCMTPLAYIGLNGMMRVPSHSSPQKKMYTRTECAHWPPALLVSISISRRTEPPARTAGTGFGGAGRLAGRPSRPTCTRYILCSSSATHDLILITASCVSHCSCQPRPVHLSHAGWLLKIIFILHDQRNFCTSISRKRKMS